MKKFIFFSVFVFIFSFYNTCFGQSLTELYTEANSSFENRKYIKAFDLFTKILNNYSDELSKEQLEKINCFQIMITNAAAFSYFEKEEFIPDNWLKSASMIIPPEQNLFNSFYYYGTLCWMLGITYHYKYEENEKARIYFLEGNYYLDKINKNELDYEVSNWISDLGSKINKVLDYIDTKTIKQGSYVTSKGSVQDWIGRVVEIKANTLKVRITYENGYTEFYKGETYIFLKDEVKILTKLSVSAILSGYR